MKQPQVLTLAFRISRGRIAASAIPLWFKVTFGYARVSGKGKGRKWREVIMGSSFSGRSGDL